MSNLVKFTGMSVAEAVKVLSGFPADFAIEAYKSWLSSFHHHLSLSYISQIQRYEDYVTRQYIYQNQLPEPNCMNEWQFDEYREYLASTDLAAMRDEHAEWTYYLELHNKREKVCVTDIELLDNYIAELLSDKPSPHAMNVQYALWGYWFDTSISNGPEKAKELRAMPYKDYLLTPHWRRVKEAMMIAYQARCQADMCVYADEGFWLDTRILHVHHMSYKNRGNERFYDLRLLCDECHKRLHNGDENVIEDYDVYDIYLKNAAIA